MDGGVYAAFLGHIEGSSLRPREWNPKYLADVVVAPFMARAGSFAYAMLPLPRLDPNPGRGLKCAAAHEGQPTSRSVRMD